MAEMLTGDPAEAPAWLRAFAGQQQSEAEAQSMEAQPQAIAPRGMPTAVPQRDPMMDSITRAIETMTQAQTRVRSGQPEDRVTAILKARAAEKPSWDEIGQAISQSFGSIAGAHPLRPQFVGVGEALNNIRANKILEAEKLAKVQIDDERLEVERQKAIAKEVSDALHFAISNRSTFQKDYEYLTGTLGLPKEHAIAILKPGARDKALTASESYNVLAEYKAYVDAGQTPPPELVTRAEAAAHILKTVRSSYMRDPQGNLVESQYIPGIPQGWPTPKGAAPVQGTVTPSAEATGKLRLAIPKEERDNLGIATQTVSEIADLLNEANKSGQIITGPIGWASKTGGGMARMAGFPIPPMAESLQRKLDLLKGFMAPEALGEKKLSNEERARLDRIVGDINPWTDERGLRQALIDLVNFIEQIKARK